MATTGQPAQAAPKASVEQVKARLDTLYRQAEEATERYNGAKERADEAQREVNNRQNELARATAYLATIRQSLGTVATAQYRSGRGANIMSLALSSSPEQYLDRADMLNLAAEQQANALQRYTAQRHSIEYKRAAAQQKLAELTEARDELARHKRTITDRLASAKRLLASLTAKQRAQYAAGHGADAARDAAAALPAPSGRAARAVAYAWHAVGKPYVWGAAGPNSFDCSGLAQASWRAAGVWLPRTTYAQVGAGTRVPRAALHPGDLVFFYSARSHVGIYIGAGQMIHAPRPGTAVQVAPIRAMPFAGAVRPA